MSWLYRTAPMEQTPLMSLNSCWVQPRNSMASRDAATMSASSSSLSRGGRGGISSTSCSVIFCFLPDGGVNLFQYPRDQVRRGHPSVVECVLVVGLCDRPEVGDVCIAVLTVGEGL